MSKFIPQTAVMQEQTAQIFRRVHTEKRLEPALKSARLLFDAEPTEELSKAVPEEMPSRNLLVEAGLTAKHALQILGRWYQERLQADKAAAAKLARESKAAEASATEKA
jgi:hypothetical protein